MSERFNVILSNDLNNAINNAVETTENTKSDFFRKALMLYLVTLDGKKQGLKVGLCDPKTKILQQEFIGL
jgi:metal-responsive CopG/Arc/MetJ family transcriptional regulator